MFGCCNNRQNMFDMNMNQGYMEPKVIEPTINKCIEKEFYHEVPHVCPIHTHVINKHIYTHTYRPAYSCSEENVVINKQCGSCCCFNKNNMM